MRAPSRRGASRSRRRSRSSRTGARSRARRRCRSALRRRGSPGRSSSSTSSAPCSAPSFSRRRFCSLPACCPPRWALSYLKKRREAKFLNLFPDAIDVIVRGIKAGLPLGDSLRALATDAPEPILTEFRHILETQAVGVPLGEACGKLFERMPLPEANFFAIVISIQQKSGGNLSEALSNLSKVLRDRKKMKGKIKAMSTEAKASAAIIGALPVAVMSIVYVTSPDYITLLWTERLGQLMLAGSAVWMLMGILVMRKMINFDF
jgi:tight adherence protein B